jgi:hypothetical protein
MFPADGIRRADPGVFSRTGGVTVRKTKKPPTRKTKKPPTKQTKRPTSKKTKPKKNRKIETVQLTGPRPLGFDLHVSSAEATRRERERLDLYEQ